jgi:cytochrome c oxidase subunit 2
VLGSGAIIASGALVRSRETPALTVRGIAHQWWWEFHYPALGIATRNRLDAPAGEVVRFELTSADVIHAFWIPGMFEPEIVAPRVARVVDLRFRRGTTVGTCSAVCGCAPGCMSFRVRARTRERFERWAAGPRHPAQPRAADTLAPPCAAGAAS